MWWQNRLAIGYQLFPVSVTTPGDGRQPVRKAVSLQVEEVNSEMSLTWCISIQLGVEVECIPYGLTSMTRIVAADLMSFLL